MGVSNREGRRKETKLEAGLSACWVFTMSGILWDPSQQPDLVESLSTFATSALALSLALPMFLVDMACCLVLSICSLLSAILTPVLEPTPLCPSSPSTLLWLSSYRHPERASRIS